MGGRVHRSIAILGVMSVLAASACSGGGTTIEGSVEDFAIELDSYEASAGEVTFSIANEGPSVHEFLIVRSGEDPASLPVNAEGIVDEALLDVVDEIPEYDPDTTEDLTVTLEAGSYIIMCNIVGHYSGGMHAGFTVG